VNHGIKDLFPRRRKWEKDSAAAELRTVSWVVAEGTLWAKSLKVMWERLRWFGKGAGVQRLEEEGQQERARERQLEPAHGGTSDPGGCRSGGRYVA
jgi:hypothetical protein